MFPIGAVERDTGIGRDTLRIWERRYGFPIPERNPKGERIYSEQQLRTLQIIKRLLDQGLRPGKVVGLQEDELQAISEQLLAPEDKPSDYSPQLAGLLDCVNSHDSKQLWTLLEQNLLKQGLKAFITDTVAPLISIIGEKWAQGDMRIFEEHFITRQLTLFIDSVISKIPVTADAKTVLLATFPGEPHSLGLLMLESLLRDKGVAVVNLGTEMPLDQLILAIKHYQVKSVLLSFSGAYNSNGIRQELLDMAQRLPDDIRVYVGGAGVKKMRKMPKQIIVKNKLKDLCELEF